MNFSLKFKRVNYKEVTGDFKLIRESFKADFRKVSAVKVDRKKADADLAEEPLDLAEVANETSEECVKKPVVSAKAAIFETASKLENIKENMELLNTLESKKSKARKIQTVLASNMYVKPQLNSPALNAISLGFVKDSVKKFSSNDQQPKRVSRSSVANIISKFETPDDYSKDQVMTPGLKAAASKRILTSFGQEEEEISKSELTIGNSAVKQKLSTLNNECNFKSEEMTPSRKAAVSAKRVTRSSSSVTLVLDQSFTTEQVDFNELNSRASLDPLVEQSTPPLEKAAPISPIASLTEVSALKSCKKAKTPTSKTVLSPRRSPRNEKRTPVILPAISVLKTKVFHASPLRNSISTADLVEKSPVKKLDFAFDSDDSNIY